MDKTKKTENKNCDMCGENANSLCFKCQMYLCDYCFKTIHSMKLSSQHKFEKIDYYVPIDLKCPEHPDVPYNLFCVDEKGNLLFIKSFFLFYRTLLLFLPFFKSS